MFTVDPHASAPVYEQLVQCVLHDVSTGELVTGDRIPPVRTLAADLGIAPGTVAKAYRELETRGMIETRGRHGTFITQSRDERDAAAARAVADYLDTVVGQWHYTPEECVAMVDRAVHKRVTE